MKQMKLKHNKGATMVDVVTAIIILSLFVGVIGNLYYQVILHNNEIKLNAYAVYYVVQIAERIDKIPYEEVTNEFNNNLREEFSIPDLYNISIDVINYNENDNSKEDIIKIVTIKAEYECFEEQKKYEIQKLKIKEI